MVEKIVPLFHYYIGKHFKVLTAISLPYCLLDRTESLLTTHLYLKASSTSSTEFTSYHDSSLYKLLSLLSTTIASVFPVLAIVLLHFVTKTSARLSIIATFTAMFSICLSLVTQARRVEIFAATAA